MKTFILIGHTAWVFTFMKLAYTESQRPFVEQGYIAFLLIMGALALPGLLWAILKLSKAAQSESRGWGIFYSVLSTLFSLGVIWDWFMQLMTEK